MSYEPTKWCCACQKQVYIGDFYQRSIRCKNCCRERNNLRWQNEDVRSRAAPRQAFVSMLHDAKRRADSKKLPFDLLDYRVELRDRYDKLVCEVSGLSLVNGRGKRQALSPSFDRVKPELGYVYSNIRIIAFCLNAAFGQWGEEETAVLMAAWLEKRDTT